VSTATPRRVLPSLSLEGKTAVGIYPKFRSLTIVTGGARIPLTCVLTKGGLGKEFLKAFAISGARSLAILDRDLPIAKEACDEIRNSVRQELGVHDDEVAEVNAWGCDVTKEDEVRRIIDEIGTKLGGKIDIFVGAAGISAIDLTD
jgi:NAD(P)-dependent dehydrogenase (short-subunit alcohol dehydrogenase family)